MRFVAFPGPIQRPPPSVGGFVWREKEILILEKAFSFWSGWHIGAFDYGDASVVDEHF